MGWRFNDNEPIYSQICDEIIIRITTGEYKPGDKFPSVRELALEAGVNPNTMQKAMQFMENEGLLHSERTSGRYVTDNESLIQSRKDAMCAKYVKEFIAKLARIGIQGDTVLNVLEKELKEDSHGNH